MGSSIQEHQIVERLKSVKPLVAHPDWLCWKDMVEDVVQLHSTNPNQYMRLFENFPHDLNEGIDPLCGVLAQLMQSSSYTMGKSSDGLPCLDLLQSKNQTPARPIDVLYAIQHRMSVAGK